MTAVILVNRRKITNFVFILVGGFVEIVSDNLNFQNHLFHIDYPNRSLQFQMQGYNKLKG